MTSGRLNFLFPDSDAHDIAEAYGRLILRVDSHFAPRWRAHSGANIDSGAFHEIIQEITLHWMYFRVINHLPPQMTELDWDHPQTRRIIQAGVKQALRRGSDTETQLCARLMGISEAEYLRWRDADGDFLSIW